MPSGASLMLLKTSYRRCSATHLLEEYDASILVELHFRLFSVAKKLERIVSRTSRRTNMTTNIVFLFYRYVTDLHSNRINNTHCD